MQTKEKSALSDSRKSRYWLGSVELKHGDLLLFPCCFVQGLLDASAFQNWGTFVGMMSGNTIILALSTGGLPSRQVRWKVAAGSPFKQLQSLA
ncbi:MAG: hypothetical protein Q9159_005675 [Coniocarpon cinnabarinum]